VNRPLLFFFAVALVLFFGSPATGQDFPMLHFTVENGLPSNNVYSVYRDSRGYIWIATDKGVARYNGIKFELFSTSNGLPDNDVFFFQEDNYGRLWLGSFNGELCYYRDGIFHSAANTPFLKMPLTETHIRHISIESDSTIIVSYNNKTKFVAIKNEACQVFDLAKSDDTSILNSVIFGRKISGNKYKLICTDKVIYIDTFCHVTGREQSPVDLTRSASFTSCQNQHYLFNDHCLYTMEMQVVRKFPQHFILSNFLHQAYITDGNTYYATNHGLFINDSLQILREDNITSITQDDRKNYWISTLNDGILVLKRDYLNSKLYRDVYKGVARYASAINGSLFFATSDNNLFMLRNNKVSRAFSYGHTRAPFDDPVNFGFFIDSNFRYFNVYHNDFTVIDNLTSPRTRTIRSQWFDGTKEICFSHGFFYLKQPLTIVRFTYGKTNKGGGYGIANMQSVSGNSNHERIFSVAKAPDNSIWYTTIDNIFRVENDQPNAVPLPQFKNIALKYFDFFGKYMVGYTHNNLLLVISNYNGGNIKVDSIAPRNCIWDKLYKIDSANILISTNGLYRLLTINPVDGEGKYTIRPVENPFLPIHPEAVCTDGTDCYFFKNGSVTVVDYKSLLNKPDPPKLFFTTLKTAKGVYGINNEIQIPFGEAKNMTVSFSTLSFIGREAHYAYSVSKSEQDNWRELNGEEINLVNPAFGTYTVKVKAKSLSSDYSEPIVFTIQVLRPFWATSTFIIFSFLVLALVTWLSTRFHILYVIRKKEREHNIEIKFLKSEYKALNALMNPHFIFNTLNNVQGLVNRNDKLAANEYIRVFADLIRQNMHNISKDLIPLQNEINLVANYLLLEKLRFKEHLNYSIKVEDGLDLSEIMIPPLLVQPLVENSIKHGILPLESKDGFIAINVYERDDELLIEVKDNGVGMDRVAKEKNPLHESFGLENVRKRIEQLSVIQNKNIRLSVYDIKNAAGNTEWTIVCISIPLSENS
jgi:hypothetical protein